jgi:quercetin 2,3-dioxygenase
MQLDLRGNDMTTTVEVRRGGDRDHTEISWLDSRHSFSFGGHYDPANTHFGLLLVSNDDVVKAGKGFDTHPHKDMEIVTWVLEGSLVHQDSTGHAGAIYPNLAQRMSAGRGIRHSERNDHASGLPDARRPVDLVQMWVVPDRAEIDPGYAPLELDPSELDSALRVVASGRRAHRDETAIGISNAYAAFYVARLAPGRSVLVPDAPFVHLYLARGGAHLEDAGALDTGDAVRLTAAGQRRIAATEAAEVLVWEMHASLVTSD